MTREDLAAVVRCSFSKSGPFVDVIQTRVCRLCSAAGFYAGFGAMGRGGCIGGLGNTPFHSHPSCWLARFVKFAMSG